MGNIAPVVAIVILLLIIYIFLKFLSQIHTKRTPFGTRSQNVAQPKKFDYLYTRRSYFMSENERDFYKRLTTMFGLEARIFPQVHLNDIFAYNHVRQNYKAALAQIQRKSVDYLVCDSEFRIRVAIELDDRSHDSDIRKERDKKVNELFKENDIPLVRIRNAWLMTDEEIKKQIYAYIKSEP